MDGEDRGRIPGAVRKLRTRLEAYRDKPGRSRRLPVGIWTSATELARIHGVSCVAQALRLNHGDLRRRAKTGKDEKKRHSAKKFVEINAGIPPWTAACTVEMEDPAGRRMTVRLMHPEVAELVDLAKVFWSMPR